MEVATDATNDSAGEAIATDASAWDTIATDASTDNADEATGGIAWDMIWTSDWCYYTVTDGLVSETVCIDDQD